MIHELEQKFGVWFAMGGTGALVRGLAICLWTSAAKFCSKPKSIGNFIDQKRKSERRKIEIRRIFAKPTRLFQTPMSPLLI
jgi:hypothetical protein